MQRCSILVLGPYVVEMRCLHNSRLLALSSSVNNIPAKNYNTDNLCGTGGQVPWQPGPCINTVQKLYEIEHFRFTVITTSIVNQSITIWHGIRNFS